MSTTSPLPMIQALTTIFTPPPTCLSVATFIPPSTTDAYGVENNAPFIGDGNFDVYDPSCYPSGYRGFFSPGVCPTGYTYACSYTESSVINKHRTSPWNPYEAYICCPSGLACPSQVGGGLYTNFAVWCQTETTTLTNIWTALPGWPSTVPSSLQLATMTPISGGFPEIEVFGGAIYVIWESTDRAIFSLLKSMSPEVYSSINAVAAWSTNVDPSTTTSSGPASTDSSLGSNMNSSTSSSTHKLSKAATISLSVIIPVFFILALLGLLLIFRHRRSRRSSNGPAPQQSFTKPELDNTSVAPQPPVEVQGNGRFRYEMGVDPNHVTTPELATQMEIAEMPTSVHPSTPISASNG